MIRSRCLLDLSIPRLSRAVISMFYGLIISMYFFDTRHHHRPHIHIHQEDLMANWMLAVQGDRVFTIDPLK